MSDNDKNKLQIYCQRNRLDLPEYSSTRTDSGMWVSTVRFTNVDGQSIEKTGHPCSKKVQADISAATAAREVVKQLDALSESDIIVNPKLGTFDLMMPQEGDLNPMFVLVDYENINKLDHLHNKFVNGSGKPVYVTKFAGYCNPKAETNETTHIVQGAGKDAVDHYISFYLGLLIKYLDDLGYEKYNIVILTRDSFGRHHISLTRQDKTVQHCSSENRCLDLLSRNGYSKTPSRVCYQ